MEDDKKKKKNKKKRNKQQAKATTAAAADDLALSNAGETSVSGEQDNLSMHNTCYRQQWGTSVRCEGWKSRPDEETVDRLIKCEKWIRDDDSNTEDSRATWWFSRLLRRPKKVTVDWPFPFAEDKLFVMTVGAGLEGYHVNVDGRHVTSFPYRTGFSLEDATGLALKGDIDVHSIFAASLPSSHPNPCPSFHQVSRKCPQYNKEAVFQSLREAVVQDSKCGESEIIERRANLSPKFDITMYAIMTNIITYDKVGAKASSEGVVCNGDARIKESLMSNSSETHI